MNGNTNEIRPEEFYKKLLDYRQQEGLATSHMGIRVTDAAPGWARGEMNFEKYHLNPIGSVHGGVIFFLADSVGGTAACTRGSVVTTSNGMIHYLKPAINPKKLIAEAEEIKAGKNILIYDVYIRTEDDTLIAKATMEYYSMHKSIL
ncbi:MAG: PaaI family thioesterase [Eubacteriales bacterium]|nr:PaaI family thioesterase [Eubacteriales bacterium]